MTSIYGVSFFTFLVSASGLTGFIAWIGIAISHFRFRRAYVAQGKDVKKLPYHAKLFPFGPILALIMTVLVTLGQDPMLLFGKTWVQGVIMYAAIPLFFILEQDWQEVRAEYVSNLKSENVQEDEEDEKEPDETVNLAKELFGEKVVEIND
mgnify:CR=1 FL=1